MFESTYSSLREVFDRLENPSDYYAVLPMEPEQREAAIQILADVLDFCAERGILRQVKAGEDPEDAVREWFDHHFGG